MTTAHQLKYREDVLTWRARAFVVYNADVLHHFSQLLATYSGVGVSVVQCAHFCELSVYWTHADAQEDCANQRPHRQLITTTQLPACPKIRVFIFEEHFLEKL